MRSLGAEVLTPEVDFYFTKQGKKAHLFKTCHTVMHVAESQLPWFPQWLRQA